jgi:phosphatidylinositol glycan class N
VLDLTDDLATRKSFRTLFSIQVHLEPLIALLYTDELIRQVLLILTTMLITASSVLNLQAKRGLPILNQLSGWTVLGIFNLLYRCCPSDFCSSVASSILPFTSRGKHHTTASKLVMFFLGFGPCFVILSISIEGLFYVAYSTTLVTWIKVEQLVRMGPGSPLSSDLDETEVNKGHTPQNIAYRFRPDDLRIALFFLFFVQVGFFGIGKYVD